MAGVVFDSTYLIDLFNPRLQPDKRAALDFLVAELSKSRVRIQIPSPCLTELLTRAGTARDKYVQLLGGSNAFDVIAFDRRAATECALLLEAAWDSKTQKGITKTKFKYDWMIVACASSRGVQRIYSDDVDILRCATEVGIKTIKQSELSIPAESRQLRIPESE